MNKTPKVSVIVPCYKVEKYLHSCLLSLKHQSFTDFEVIVVIDGSPDNCEAIALDFQKEDSRFKVLTISNSGQGAARNHAIKNACGDFFLFLDSDDKILSTYIEKLYSTAIEHEADIVTCNYSKFYEKNSYSKVMKHRKLKAGTYSSTEIQKRILNDWTVRSYLWNKIFKRTLFTENNILFPDILFEDIATVIRLVEGANKVVAIEDALYYYTIRSGSTMTTLLLKKNNDYLKSYAIVRNFLEKKGTIKQFRLPLLNLLKSVLFVNAYQSLCIHLQQRSLKGMFKNIGTSIIAPFKVVNLGDIPYSSELDLKYKLHEPSEFCVGKNDINHK